MFEVEKRKMIEAGKVLDRYGLIALSGGNVSLRTNTGEIIVTPSGMPYEELSENDLIVMNINGEIIEGSRRPSVDNKALRYIFEKREDVNAIIHTHQPYATGIGLMLDQIECNLTTLANSTKGAVNVAPYSSAASIDMGIKTVEYIGKSLAVVLRHHGVVTIGKDLKEALYSAVYLEEACKTLAIARIFGEEFKYKMTTEQINDAVEVFNNYGQK